MFWKKGDLPIQLSDVIGIYQKVMLACASKETSADPDNWLENDPSRGNCVPFAIFIKETFGGEILRASLAKVAGYENMGSHYWNRLLNGAEIDLARDQFKGGAYNLIPEGSNLSRDDNPITVESLLKNPDVKKRFELLRERLSEVLGLLYLTAEIKNRGEDV